MSDAARDVLVVGGGVIGLTIAWRAAQRGLSVAVIDDGKSESAWHAAAGMLAPVTEVHYGETALLRLNLASAEAYPAFVHELEETTGLATGYRTCGTLAVAFDSDDRAALDDLARYQESLGLKAEPLTGRECRRLEPMLSPGVRGGLMAHGDHQVDNRALVAALRATCDSAGVEWISGMASQLTVEGDRAVGVDDHRAETVVLAAGAWSNQLTGVPEVDRPPVRPVKGQILRLKMPAQYSLLSRTIRAIVQGGPVYLVPRTNGEIVIGATVEEQAFDARLTAGGVYELLRDAHEILPGITECELVECTTGLRPGSPDNAPLLGAASLPGLVIATGHYRNGILLAPVTGDSIAELLVTGEAPDLITPFTPQRFTSARTTQGAPA
jgi:glycine oxidase